MSNEGDDREETSDEVEEPTTLSAWSNPSGEHEYLWRHPPRWSQVYWSGGPSNRSWCSDPLCHQNPEESWTVWSTTLGSHLVYIPESTYICLPSMVRHAWCQWKGQAGKHTPEGNQTRVSATEPQNICRNLQRSGSTTVQGRTDEPASCPPSSTAICQVRVPLKTSTTGS